MAKVSTFSEKTRHIGPLNVSRAQVSGLVGQVKNSPLKAPAFNDANHTFSPNTGL
jgi:hypothetical protein